MLRTLLFNLLARLAARHGAAVLVVATLLSALGAALSTRIELKTNFKDALGPDDPMALQQVYMEENFPDAYSVQIALEGRDVDRLIEVARDLAPRLEAHEEVRTVYLEQPVDFFVRHGLLCLHVADLQALDATLGAWEDPLGQLLGDPSLFGLLDALGRVGEQERSRNRSVSAFATRAVASVPIGAEALDLLGIDAPRKPVENPAERAWKTARAVPLPMSDASARGKLTRATQTLALVADVLDQGDRLTPDMFAQRVQRLRDLDYAELGDAGKRYRVSPDGGMLVIDVTATRNVGKIDQAMPFVAAVQQVVKDVARGNPDVSLSLTGLPVMLIEEQEAVLDNFLLVSLLGFIGILAVFVIGFERVGLPSLAAIPLVMGILWTFGVQALAYGEMNLFTMAFPVLLFGVGIDFAIHQIAGYAEQRNQGHEPEEALRRTYDRIGAGLLTGGITTAAAFLVMLAGQSYGMRSMGFTAGVGILMALLAMLTVMPALMVMWDRRQAKGGELLPDVPFSFLAPVGRAVQRFRYPVLAVFLTLTIALAYTGADVDLNQNYIDSVPSGLPALQTQDRIVAAFGASNEVVTLFADDLAHAERIRKSAEASGTVAQVISADVLLPALQEAKRPHIEAIARRLAALAPVGERPAHDYDDAELDRLHDGMGKLKLALLDYSLLGSRLYGRETQEAIGELRDVVNRIDARLNPSSAERIRYLDEMLATEIAASFAVFQDMGAHTSVSEADLPAAVVDRLRGRDGKWMVLVKAEGDVWDQTYREIYLAELDNTGAPYAGLVPAAHVMMAGTVADAPRLTVLILAMVSLIVLIDLRSLRATLLALVPLLVGLVWTLGVMGVFGLRFNVISMIAVPLIVGIGIDDGVHVYHRIRKERSIGPALVHSGKPVILTSLTTGIGFGSLMLSIHPGFFSLGLVTTIGIFSCLFLSLLLLPALVAIFDEDVLTAEPPQTP